MKATIADRPPKGEEWLFEVKWDGVRAVAFVEKEEVRLQSRTGQRCERQYPELAVIPHQVAAETAVLDGEIAVLDEKGVSQFHLIQPRIANTDPNSIAHLARSTPVVYFAFDLLYLDGYDLREVALAERRELLESGADAGARVCASRSVFPNAGEQLLEAARENGSGRDLAKRARSRYESRRSRDWLKIKIIGRAGVRDRRLHGAAGRARVFRRAGAGGPRRGQACAGWGTWARGSTRRLLAGLHARLEPLMTQECPFAERPKPDRGMTWVRPELVCQVKFGSWTQDGRLRAPVFLGLRRRRGRRREVATREPSSELLAASREGSDAHQSDGRS